MDIIFEELKKCTGAQFDPKVVEVFLRVSGNLQNIEDEAIIAKDLQMTLQDIGYDVPAIAYSGE